MDREETKGSSLWNKILAGIYFPALILFLEVVFNLSTVKTMNGPLSHAPIATASAIPA